MQRFQNKFALITGGTNGMGLATARQFIAEGGKVIITGRSAETVHKAYTDSLVTEVGIANF